MTVLGGVRWAGVAVYRHGQRGAETSQTGTSERAAAPLTPRPNPALPTDCELAWQLASEITDVLDSADRERIYLRLGCGDHYDAIIDLLQRARARGVTLSPEATARVAQWITGYRGTAEESALRSLLGRPSHSAM